MNKARLVVSFVLLAVAMMSSPAAFAQGSGQFAGVTQCWINGTLTPVRGSTCPSTGSGSGTSGANSAANSNMYNGFYQLGYQFGRWLFSSNSDPQAELQKQQMMAELQRRQAEAERLHQEEEARRLAAMYNRLSATLKLSGLPNLQLKDVASSSPGLALKLGDNTNGQAGIKGLPGIYLNDGTVPYGIPGLPGIYTGGPGQGSGLTDSKLALKTGDSAGPTAQSTMLDPSKMTPQQLADVAEQFSKLPPEEQQRMLSGAQDDAAAGQQNPGASGQPSAQALAPVQAQATASQAAASAPTLEDASAGARAGFDTPLGPAATPPVVNNSTPSMLRSPGTSLATDPVAAAPSSAQAPNSSRVSDDILFLFPGSQSTSPFPRSPNPPLTNPLREEQRVQTELKRWDDWVIERATHLNDPADPLYPAATVRAELNTAAVNQYAPELLARYRGDAAFRQSVDLRLQYANEHVAPEYYQLQADAHKAAVLAFQAELDKLAAEGKIDKLTPLADQLVQHPELQQVVKAVRERVDANEQTALANAQAEGLIKVDKEYQFAFRLIRGEAAQQH